MRLDNLNIWDRGSLWVNWLTDDVPRTKDISLHNVDLKKIICVHELLRSGSILCYWFHHWFWELLFHGLLWLCPSPFDTLIILCMYKRNGILHYSHVNKYRLSVFSAVRYEKSFYYTHTKPFPAGTLTHTHDNDSWAGKQQTRSKSWARTLKDSLRTWETE